AILLLLGMGMGMFAAPNATAVMNAVPPRQRGASSGMMATFQNTGMTLSMTLYFAILIIGLAQSLPPVLYQGLVQTGVPAAAAQQISNMPPTSALFAAFLGYNPMGTLIPQSVLSGLSDSARATLLGNQFFPLTIAPAVMSSLRVAFYISAALSGIAAVLSFMRGKRFVHGE
ncbi:MAG: MFS transporter, partial [Eubacteriales bacterium]